MTGQPGGTTVTVTAVGDTAVALSAAAAAAAAASTIRMIWCVLLNSNMYIFVIIYICNLCMQPCYDGGSKLVKYRPNEIYVCPS